MSFREVFTDKRVARYNFAVWPKPGNGSRAIQLLGREVLEPGAPGQPDVGVLKLYEMDSSGAILKERTIWEPTYPGLGIEDPRALLESDKVVWGVTAVLRDADGAPIPFPAIIKIDSLSTWNQELPPVLLVTTFGPGKNTTPVDENTFLFRQEDHHHKILAFSLHHQVPEKLSDIEFPTNLPWAEWRIGTTMPPIWMSDTEALFIVHGITIREGKYIYSLGRAKLTRLGDTFTVDVSPEPILTPDSFMTSDGIPLVEELHPELRRVVYCCGGYVDSEDTLVLYVNVGDRTTFEVKIPMSQLKQGLF